tara:strand:- start:34 stop:228 length:195 start_codon:yes stop_codon:yes gene_type:complete
MFIDTDYQRVEVPQEIIEYCDVFTYDADRDDLRYIDCIYMHMGDYGNDPEHLKKLREQIVPVFD